MDITKYEIVIMHHALIRALMRGVTADMVEATIKGGLIIRFGKDCVRFERRYKRFTVVCVDHVCGDIIRIVTIETR
jgi:hypothetical protein